MLKQKKMDPLLIRYGRRPSSSFVWVYWYARVLAAEFEIYQDWALDLIGYTIGLVYTNALDNRCIPDSNAHS